MVRILHHNCVNTRGRSSGLYVNMFEKKRKRLHMSSGTERVRFKCSSYVGNKFTGRQVQLVWFELNQGNNIICVFYL